MVSQLTIARKLNISAATVSRCLRGHPGADPITRARVLELASEFGYADQLNGLTKRRGRPARNPGQMTTLAVIVQLHESGIHEGGTIAQLLAGMSADVGGERVGLMVHHIQHTDREAFSELHNQPAILRDGVARGAILVRDFSPRVVQALSRQLPCVSLVLDYGEYGIDCVGSDQRTGIFTAVQKLHQAGHRRFGFVTGADSQSWAWARMGAFMEATSGLGCPPTHDDVINELVAPIGPQRRAELVAARIREGVTGWVFASDTEAQDVIARVAEQGLQVPTHFSAVGFNAYPAGPGQVRLCSIRNRYEAIGAAGVRRLLERIERPAEARRHVQIACEWVEGESIGPPPAASPATV